MGSLWSHTPKKKRAVATDLRIALPRKITLDHHRHCGCRHIMFLRVTGMKT